MQYVGKQQLREELDQDAELHCGPDRTDHDWSIHYPHGILSVGSNWHLVELALSEHGSEAYAECNWCAELITQEILNESEERGSDGTEVNA